MSLAGQKSRRRFVSSVSAFLAAWVCRFPLAAEEGQDTTEGADGEFLCATPQFSKYDKIISLGKKPIPFAYNADRQLTLNPLIGAGETISLEQFQLALGSDAWKRSDGLDAGKKIKIGVQFLDGMPQQHELVRRYAPLWTAKGAPFEFVFGKGNHIRITFNALGNWSSIGRQARAKPSDDATMSLQQVSPGVPETRQRRVILHEFGHALGMRHEHLQLLLGPACGPKRPSPGRARPDP